MLDSLKLIELLKKENYEIKVHQHDTLFTVEDSKKKEGKSMVLIAKIYF